jgi:multidrug efflux pump subunit AcrA (membrane-fusion protein)
MTKLVLVLALVACSGESAKRSSSAIEKARTAAVKRGEVTDRVLVTGALFATSAEELRVPRTDAWELPIRWMAEDGTAVKAGERALEFDNGQFTATLEEKKLALLEAENGLASFRDVSALELAQKDFTLQANRVALDKAKVLASVPADLLPARTAQERQLEVKRAQSAVETAERELASAKAAQQLDLRVKQIELDKARTEIETAEKAIDALLLKAPRDGIIVIGEHPWEGRKFQIGDSVQPGWTIVSLPDFGSGMEVRAELSDVDDGRVSVGMTGTCTLDAFPDRALPCAVKQLMPVATGQGRSLRRAFSIVLTLDKVDQERMRPGMSVKVELHRGPESGLVVPRGAIRFARGSKTARVMLASGGAREVELGSCDAQGCIVTKGLGDGEAVRIGGVP